MITYLLYVPNLTSYPFVYVVIGERWPLSFHFLIPHSHLLTLIPICVSFSIITTENFAIRIICSSCVLPTTPIAQRPQSLCKKCCCEIRSQSKLKCPLTVTHLKRACISSDGGITYTTVLLLILLSIVYDY